MKQKTNKEVINSNFYELLKRERLLIDYFHCWANENHIPQGMSIFEAWEEWSKIIKPEQYVMGAFVFEKTHIPISMLYSLTDKWKTWIADNLNN